MAYSITRNKRKLCKNEERTGQQNRLWSAVSVKIFNHTPTAGFHMSFFSVVIALVSLLLKAFFSREVSPIVVFTRVNVFLRLIGLPKHKMEEIRFSFMANEQKSLLTKYQNPNLIIHTCI